MSERKTIEVLSTEYRVTITRVQTVRRACQEWRAVYDDEQVKGKTDADGQPLSKCAYVPTTEIVDDETQVYRQHFDANIVPVRAVVAAVNELQMEDE